ncbi:MAG TPA: hypothetical protein ENN38_03540 [Actinobacteria bacterium]|nr:hypothetical protein [Actinomycetota bacterium]
MLGEVSDGYVDVNSNVWVKKFSFDLFKKIDSLVLDIDGVILDVTSSFRVAITKTTQFYFKNILKWPGEAILISPEETQLFKLAGGFNNDWELTYAVIAFYLGKSVSLSSQDLNVLWKKGRSLKGFTKEIKRLGGGIASAEDIILSDSEYKGRIKALWNRNLIKQIFQEFYAGMDWCEKLYGFSPEFIKEKGLLNKEKVIISKDLVEKFYPKVSVITGRIKEEAEVALEKANLSNVISFEKVLSDDGGIRKPNPKMLVSLSDKMNTGVGVYVGDTPDDLEMVNNFKKLGRSDKFLSCIVLREAEDAQRFIEDEVDVLAISGDDVLVEIDKFKEG